MREIDVDVGKKIISKTDTKGRILMANDYFYELAGYSEDECYMKPHNIIRHSDMPKLVFRLLWVKLRYGMEVNAFVKNRTKHGEYYWVFATVSPTFKPGTDEIVAYYSIRKKANPEAIEIMSSIYEDLNKLESQEGKEASKKALKDILDYQGIKFNVLMSRLQAQGKSALKS